MVEFSGNITNQEQQLIEEWLQNHKLLSSQVVKINNLDYNFIVVFENEQPIAIRVIK